MIEPYFSDGDFDPAGAMEVVNDESVALVRLDDLNAPLPSGKEYKKIIAQLTHIKRSEATHASFYSKANKKTINRTLDPMYNRMLVCR